MTPKTALLLPLDELDYDDDEYGAWAFPWPAERKSFEALSAGGSGSKQSGG
jgi:hypothetical protein